MVSAVYAAAPGSTWRNPSPSPGAFAWACAPRPCCSGLWAEPRDRATRPDSAGSRGLVQETDTQVHRGLKDTAFASVWKGQRGFPEGETFEGEERGGAYHVREATCWAQGEILQAEESPVPKSVCGRVGGREGETHTQRRARMRIGREGREAKCPNVGGDTGAGQGQGRGRACGFQRRGALPTLGRGEERGEQQVSSPSARTPSRCPRPRPQAHGVREHGHVRDSGGHRVRPVLPLEILLLFSNESHRHARELLA